MGSVSTAILRAGYEALYFSGASHLLRPWFRGVGAILAVSRVCEPWREPWRQSWKLAVTPRHLEAVVLYLRRRKFDIVSPDEVKRRLDERDFRPRFVCLTLDGAYRDHYERAWPVFQKHRVPFTLFVPTGFPDRVAELWWVAVATVVANNPKVSMLVDGREQRVDCATKADKRYLADGLMRWLMARDSDDEIVTFVRDLAVRYDVDLAAIREKLCMTWEQIGALARDPLVTIGAQSVSHPILTKLSPQRLERELRMSRAVIEGATGKAPRHFAYPFGQPEAAGAREFRMAEEVGYATAMTMRPGVLTRDHADRLTALPRIALRPDFPYLRHLQVAMSGVPEAIAAKLRRGEAD